MESEVAGTQTGAIWDPGICKAGTLATGLLCQAPKLKHLLKYFSTFAINNAKKKAQSKAMCYQAYN